MTVYRKKLKVIVEKTKTGCSAFAEEYNVFTTGKSITELRRNLVEAFNLYFEEENIKITQRNIELEIDLKQFFQFYRVINSKFLAERIGMNPTLLSQYVQGRKRPSHAQTDKIISGIQEIGRELSELQLIKHSA